MVNIQPIFKEYIQFLKDKSVDLNLEEGYYWLDRQIIKAYDKQGKLHKVHRLHIDDDLNITCKSYKVKKFEMESWQDTIKRNKLKIEELEKDSINIIKEKLNKFSDYTPVVFTSTGKDSEVTRHLVEKIVSPLIMFSNTTMDSYDTYQIVKKHNNYIITTPKEPFYKKLKEWGVPNRTYRWCCSTYKEGETKRALDKNKKYLFFYGMRNQESLTRKNYQDERFDDGWGTRYWMGILPIRKWTEEDIWLYIIKENILINPKYHKGYSRVGCAIACPYYTKSTWVLDKYWYPKMYKRWHDILEKDFMENYKWTRLNCTLEEYHSCWNGGLKREEPTLEVIHEFAYYKMIAPNVAEKYFNHECTECGKKVNKKDEIAMNLKLLGRNIENYYCKKHLIEQLNITKEQWNEYINDFKRQGCDLF